MVRCGLGLINSPQAAQLCHQLRLKLSLQIRMNLFWQAKIAESTFVQGIGYGRGGGIAEWNGIVSTGKLVTP